MRAVRWQTGAIIASVVGLAKADASVVGVVAPELKANLHITTAELGLVASLASVSAAVCALPAGGLVDRRHRVAVTIVALVIWSAALGVAGFATGLVLLAVGRIVGSGVATIARPVSVSLAGDIYDPGYRGRALAALDAGQAVGTAFCFLLGAIAIHLLDWRWLFWWLAGLGVVLAVTARSLDDPVPVRDHGPSLGVVLRLLLSIRTNVIVIVADSIGNFFFAGVASFAVLFISERYDMSTALIDALAPLVAAGVIVGIVAGGRLGDRLTRERGGSRRLVVASGCQLAATGIFALSLLSPTIVIGALLLFCGATVLGGAGPCLDAVRVDIVASGIRGRAEAARGLLTLFSAALGPITFGLVATAFGRPAETTSGSSQLASGLALRDAFLVMLIPLAVGALTLLLAIPSYAADAAAAGTAPGAGMLEE
jgi:MFS family permease